MRRLRRSLKRMKWRESLVLAAAKYRSSQILNSALITKPKEIPAKAGGLKT